MAKADDFKKKLQSDKGARDKFASDVADVLKKHGYDVDSSKINSQLTSSDADTAAAWAVSIVNG